MLCTWCRTTEFLIFDGVTVVVKHATLDLLIDTRQDIEYDVVREGRIGFA